MSIERINKKSLSVIGLLLFGLLNLFSTNTFSRDETYNAQIVLFLNLGQSSSENLSTTIDSILIGDGEQRFPMPMQPLKLDSKKQANSQIRLAEISLPPGLYDAITICFGDIETIIEDETVHLRTNPDGFKLAIQTKLEAESAVPIFLEWIPGSVAPDDFAYRFNLKIVHPEIPPAGSLLFVTNEKSNNIAVVNRFSNRVVDLIRSGAAPRAIVYSPFNHQLYVANSSDNSLATIDVQSLQVTQTVELDFGDEPGRLCLSDDEQQLYVLNYGSNSLTIFSLPDFQQIDRQIVDPEPVGLAADLSFIYISSRLADEISIYDPVNGVFSTPIEINSAPGEIYVNAENNLLYLSADDYRTLTIYDTQYRSLLSSINLCSGISGMAYNSTQKILYAALDDCREIDIIKVEEGLIIDRISLPGQPGLITLEPENRRLYVTLPDLNKVAVINVISKKVIDIIDAGQGPYMMAIAY